MNRFTVGAIIAVLLAFGGLIVWSTINGDNKTNFDAYDSSSIIAANEDNGHISDHVRGKEDSSIKLVEYADFQCPGCASMMPKITKLYEKYGDRVAFIFRSFPIDGHQNARSASAAAESAGLQGYFWEMAELLYDNRTDWYAITDTEKRTNKFIDLFNQASGGKGDVELFKSDINNTEIAKKVDFDKNIGRKKDKVDATPSFYINGEKIDIESTSEPVDAIEEKINEALKKAGLETGAKE